ncbi:hypothetical protein NA57DRAFT_61135 [Rhizodiscina lignyota]|uniref:Uncharacterized protein n=1 Tax=Rhizodiscina lignyota TaxID=1504668 RepID=A0A9P4I7N4_9PEZI|nr:hypothetical protein NA57DRAFT_61135 [Rhizodiscina lignyota]
MVVGTHHPISNLETMSNFEQLPRELLDMIYDCVLDLLPSEHHRIQKCAIADYIPTAADPRKKPQTSHALRLIKKSMAWEYLERAYRYVRLELWLDFWEMWQVAQYLRCQSDSLVSNLRSLYVALVKDDNDILDQIKLEVPKMKRLEKLQLGLPSMNRVPFTFGESYGLGGLLDILGRNQHMKVLELELMAPYGFTEKYERVAGEGWYLCAELVQKCT